MIIQTWAETTTIALQSLWQGFLSFIPNLIGSLVVFLIGWLIAIGIGKLVTEVLIRLKLNKILEKSGWQEALNKAELKVNPAEFIGGIIKWIFVIVFLLAAVEILGFVQFTDFLKSVISYLPNVIVAALIFVVTVILVDIVEKVVRTTVEGMKTGYGRAVSIVVKWSIWIFSILAILDQLRFEAADWIFALIKIVFVGLVAMLAISFGLGGKEVAAEILRDLKEKIKR